MNADRPHPNESSIPSPLPRPPRLPELDADSREDRTIPGTPKAWQEVLEEFRGLTKSCHVLAARVEEQGDELARLQEVVKGYAHATERAASAAEKAANAAIAAVTAMEQRFAQMDQLLADHAANHPRLSLAAEKR